MRGSRIPSANRIINAVPPLNPSDMSEANALNLMYLWDNMGTGDFLQDASVLTRHKAQLFAREQAVPNLTVEVLAGIGWFSQNSYVNFAGGNSPVFTAPATNPRRDILTLRSDGLLYRIAGAEGVSPVAPTIPSTDIPIAQIFNRVGQTVIHDNDTQVAGQGYIEFDLRPFLQIAVGSSAMPKIGIVARVQLTSTASTTLQDVVNFSGAGRLRLVHAVSAGGGAGTRKLRITIDGTILFNDTTLAAGVAYDIKPAAANSSNNFQKVITTEDPGQNLDLFFKSSLLIEHAGDGVGFETTTVEYERE